MGRTNIAFNITTDIWEVVDDWVYQNDLGLIKATPSGDMRTYAKSVVLGKFIVDLTQKGGAVRIEAYFNDGIEWSIDHINFFNSVPRKKCREIMNQLLRKFNQPPLN